MELIVKESEIIVLKFLQLLSPPKGSKHEDHLVKIYVFKSFVKKHKLFNFSSF